VCTALSAICFEQGFAPFFPRASVYLAIIATVALTGTLFEITTTLGRKHADRAAPAAARYLRAFELAMLPLAVPLGWIGQYLSNKEVEIPPDPKVAEAEVEIMVEEVERSGLFGREPAEMIRNVLEFADLTARDVMIPRAKIEAIEFSTPLEKALKHVTESGHSRYPVYREQVDNIVGLLYAKDLFKVLEEHRLRNTTLKELVRTPANFVAESQSLSSLLREMRGRRQHMAVVVDEFGGLSGIVTLEDVLEEIVGDIRDEHDEAPSPEEVAEEAARVSARESARAPAESLDNESEPPSDGAIQDLGDGRLVADAGVSMGDLSAYLGADLAREGNSSDSIGGMLTEHVGRVPEVGTAISKYGLRFIVRDSDEKAVGKVEIIRPRAVEA